MGAFKSAVITTKCQALLTKVIAGKTKLTFTKIAVSEQALSGDLASKTSIGTIKQSNPVASIVQQNPSNVKVSASFTNKDLTAGYYVRNIGLYATDPNDGEILYSIAVADESTATADWMPPFNGIGVSSLLIDMVTAVSNTDKVNITVDPTATATVSQILDLQEQINDIQAYVGYSDADIVGVEVDFTNNKFTRLAGAVNRTAGEGFDDIPCFGGRRRVNLSDDGYVIAYEGGDGFSYSGSLQADVSLPIGVPGAGFYPSGTPVQVMVEQPKFYYKVVPLELERIGEGEEWSYTMKKVRYYVSSKPKKGFKLHPAFIENGNINEYIYLSAFEGSIFDDQQPEHPYIVYDDPVIGSNPKFCSIAGVKPASGKSNNLTRAMVRLLAHSRGKGWEQAYIATASASQLLMLIEYASFNMQTAIGDGVVNLKDDGSTNMAERTGLTISLGSKSGNASDAVTYRGEENFWGNIWGWVDGININNEHGPHGGFCKVFVADHDFTDNTNAAPYENTGIFASTASGYIKALGYSEKFDWLFIPSSIGGTAALPVGDNYYAPSNTGWYVATLGGGWSSGAYAGAFGWDFNNASSYRYRRIGGRLVYVPSKNVED